MCECGGGGGDEVTCFKGVVGMINAVCLFWGRGGGWVRGRGGAGSGDHNILVATVAGDILLSAGSH